MIIFRAQLERYKEHPKKALGKEQALEVLSHVQVFEHRAERSFR